jgi:hypothetical protein
LLISIFNGRTRSLGEGERRDVHLKVSVGLRKHLHLFKRACLAVFMAIALHSDDQGWAWPKVATLCKETGYDDDAVYKALNLLVKLTIRGERVLLRTKIPPPHYIVPKDKGKYSQNFYLIFPTAEDCKKYETEVAENELEGEKTTSEKPDTVFPDTEKPGTEKPDTVFRGTKKIHGSEPEPGSKPEPKTHTHQNHLPLDESSAAGEEKRVCVSSDLTFEDYLGFARSQPSFHTPDAWAMKHFPLRDADALVVEWREKRKPEKIAEVRAATPNRNFTYHYALQVIGSIMESHGSDPIPLIAEMPLDDDVRARLLAKFGKQNSPQEAKT